MTTSPRKEPGIAPVVELLASRGAAGISHPGGTLLAHLERVHALLGQWGARPVVQRAGLCHAFYGTDGFATALGDSSHRRELAAIIGQQAERLVYFYASCDRRYSYPHLAERSGRPGRRGAAPPVHVVAGPAPRNRLAVGPGHPALTRTPA